MIYSPIYDEWKKGLTKGGLYLDTIYRLIDDGLLVAMQSMARGKIRFTAKALQDYITSTQINPKKKKEVS